MVITLKAKSRHRATQAGFGCIPAMLLSFSQAMLDDRSTVLEPSVTVTMFCVYKIHTRDRCGRTKPHARRDSHPVLSPKSYIRSPPQSSVVTPQRDAEVFLYATLDLQNWCTITAPMIPAVILGFRFGRLDWISCADEQRQLERLLWISGYQQ